MTKPFVNELNVLLEEIEAYCFCRQHGVSSCYGTGLAEPDCSCIAASGRPCKDIIHEVVVRVLKAVEGNQKGGG